MAKRSISMRGGEEAGEAEQWQPIYKKVIGEIEEMREEDEEEEDEDEEEEEEEIDGQVEVEDVYAPARACQAQAFKAACARLEEVEPGRDEAIKATLECDCSIPMTGYMNVYRCVCCALCPRDEEEYEQPCMCWSMQDCECWWDKETTVRVWCDVCLVREECNVRLDVEIAQHNTQKDALAAQRAILHQQEALLKQRVDMDAKAKVQRLQEEVQALEDSPNFRPPSAYMEKDAPILVKRAALYAAEFGVAAQPPLGALKACP